MKLIQSCIALQGKNKWTKSEAHLLLPYQMLFFTATLLSLASILIASPLSAPVRIAIAIGIAALASLLPAIGIIALIIIIAILLAGTAPLATVVSCICLILFIGSSQPMFTLLVMTLSIASGGVFAEASTIILVFGLYLAHRYETPAKAKLGITVPIYSIYTVASLMLFNPELNQNPIAFIYFVAIGIIAMLLFGFIKLKKTLKIRILHNLPADFIVFMLLAGVLIGASVLAQSFSNWEAKESILSILLSSLGALALSRLFDDEGLVLLFKKQSHARELLSKEKDTRTAEEKVLGSLSASKKTYRKQLFSVIFSGLLVAVSSFATLQLLKCGWPLWVQIIVSIYSFGLPFVWEFGDDLLTKNELSDSAEIASNFSGAVDFFNKLRDIICCIFVAFKVIAIYLKAIRNAPAKDENEETRESKNFFENFFNRILHILDSATGTQPFSGVVSYAASETGASAISAVATNSFSTQVLPIALSAALAVTSTGLAKMPVQEPPQETPVIVEQIAQETPAHPDYAIFSDYPDIELEDRAVYAFYDVIDSASYDVNSYDFFDLDNTIPSTYDVSTYVDIAPVANYTITKDGVYGLIVNDDAYSSFEEHTNDYAETEAFVSFGTTNVYSSPETSDPDALYRTWLELKAGDVVKVRINGKLGNHNKPAINYKFVEYHVEDNDPVDERQFNRG